MYAENGWYTCCSHYMRIANSNTMIAITDSEFFRQLLDYMLINIFNKWEFAAYTIDFEAQSLNITKTIDNLEFSTITVDGFAF